MIAVFDQHGALLRLDFEDDVHRLAVAHGLDALPHDAAAATVLGGQLAAYFNGKRFHFALPLAPRGSAFLQRAWQQLACNRYGTTATYGQIAQLLRPPSSARAIGRANAINPLSIIIPCHRVLAANGGLAGYSAGLGRKARLLAFEAEVRADLRRCHDDEVERR